MNNGTKITLLQNLATTHLSPLYSIQNTSVFQKMDFAETSANQFLPQTVPPPKKPLRLSFAKRDSKQSTPKRQSKMAPQPAPQQRHSSLMASAFQKADLQLAVEKTKAKGNRFFKGEEIGLGVELEHFKRYGPGIYLFFHFLRGLCGLFLALSVIALIPAAYNYFSGNGLANRPSSASYHFARTTIACYDSSSDSVNDSHKLFNTIPDLLGTLVFLGFYFYWLRRSTVLTEKVRNEVRLRSYSVVELISPPPNASPVDVSEFFSQFGRVEEVAAVKNYDETIRLSRRIYELEVQVRELELEGRQQLVGERQAEIDEVYKELVLYEDDIKDETIKYFVTFANIQDRQKCLAELQPYMGGPCCTPDAPLKFLLAGQLPKVISCHTEPAEIIWQNQHVTWKSRWLRALVQWFFLLMMVGAGFLFISFLNVLTPASASSTSVDTSYLNATTVFSANSTLVQSWCVSHATDVLSSGDSSLQTLCWDYLVQYYLKIAMGVGIAVAVIIIKALLRKVVVYLAKFQRYQSHTDQSCDITVNLFLIYLSTTVLITFLLQAQVAGISFKSLISRFLTSDSLTANLASLGEYSDFVTNWYLDIGYQIFLTWVILAVHPTLTMPVVHYLQEWWAHWRAESEEVQAKMEKVMEPAEFELEDHYANILMIVYVGLALSPGMPLMTLATALALALRYFYFKLLFIRFSKVPKAYDEALDLKVVGLLPYALLLHLGIGVWMLGVSSIFTISVPDFISSIYTLDYAWIRQIGFIMQRVLGTWYYSMILGLVLVTFVFKVVVYNLLVRNLLKEEKVVAVPVGSGELWQSSRSICASYKIENNPDYGQILSIMHKKRKFIVRVKDASQ